MGIFSSTRRAFLAGVVVTFGAAGVVTVCSAEEVYEGGTLRVSVAGSPRLLDPPITGSVEEWIVTSLFYNNLTAVDKEFRVHPDLAESWTAENEGREWIFVLRQGVKFHSGRDLTAEDVVASISRVIDPATNSRGRGALGPITAVEALDTHLVKFTLGQPIADFPSNLALPYARIVPKDVAVNLNTEEDGTGPFVLKEFVVGEKIIAEKNPNYFKAGKPRVDRIQFTVYPDSTAEINALKDGQTDIIMQVRPDQVDLLADANGVVVEEVPTGTFVPIVMRSDKPPFDNPLVRKALKLTLDRDAIVNAVLGGHGVVANDQSLPPSNPFFNADIVAPKRDIETAKKLLAEAGYADGLKATLYTSDARVGMLPVALMAREMSREAGFDLDIQNVTWDVFLNTIWEKQSLYVNNWFARPTTDTSILPFFVSRDKGGSLNDFYYSNPEVDDLLLGAQGELDTDKRREMLHKAQKIISEDGPAVITFFRNNITAFRDYVREYSADPGISFPAEEIWLKK
ncbi:ABC transporter substrate-binding protein [Aminobacter sp. J44]|uniref:ABC transporter substrate-binding protein n=1 Tax=Aminobacter sp. J44 TaxID=935262 RepID=UPI00119C380A|nr:ABC transporter substrate-binding protein [Aminobacter sp. J44]TWG53207.1 peptide/nickel transport system substrate-binding protein [Aminobacter sp. J44]